AGRNTRGLLAKLQRRGGDVTLADADTKGVALLPGLVIGLLLPCAAGNQTAALARQLDAGGRAQAQFAGRRFDPVDAHAPRRLVEENIAAVLERALHVQRAVP